MIRFPSLASSAIPSSSSSLNALPSSSTHHSSSSSIDTTQQYHHEFHEIQNIIKSTMKSKKYSEKNEFGQILSQANKSDLCHDDWESWALKHGKRLRNRYTTNEIRQLRKWFLELDRDKSGEVGYAELVDPLLSAGIVKSKEDVRQLIRLVDTDGSGEISFEEFLVALNQDRICDKSKISVLQNVTRESKTGLSTAMKLSEERRKHLISTVIDETEKRQNEIEKIYQKHSPHSLPSYHSSHSRQRPSKLPQLTEESQDTNSPSKGSKKRRKDLPKIFESKLEKAALSHFKQITKSTLYVNSLEPIVSSHKTTIATDNVVDTTKTHDIYNTSVHTVIEDPDLDIGYRDGLEGRRRSLHKLNIIDPSKFVEGTFINLQQKESDDHDDYTKYDSHYTVYAPKEVTDVASTTRSHRHLKRQSSTSKSSHITQRVPKLSPIVQHSPSFSFPSQRFTKSNLHGEDSICETGRVTFRKQLSSSRIDDHNNISPAPTGRKPITKSYSKVFYRQNSSHNSLQEPSTNPHSTVPVPAAAVTARRRSSVVKHFYRQNTFDLPVQNEQEH